MIKNLTSRKFIVAVVSIVSGILGMFNFFFPMFKTFLFIWLVVSV